MTLLKRHFLNIRVVVLRQILITLVYFLISSLFIFAKPSGGSFIFIAMFLACSIVHLAYGIRKIVIDKTWSFLDLIIVFLILFVAYLSMNAYLDFIWNIVKNLN